VAYDGMDNFFPAAKIVFTGNPVRAAISGSKITKQKALKFFDLQENKKTVLVIGGSLGARTINQSMDAGIEKINAENIQLIWQTGKGYFEIAKRSLVREDTNQRTNSTPRLVSSLTSIKVFDFIKQMDMAYAAADVIISRAGALSVSELCIIGKPCVLVPSPNVAEDHQTKNAMALVNKNAAMLVKDTEAKEKLISTLLEIIKDETHQNQLIQNIKQLAIADADERIFEEIRKLIVW
jgi:UDP-N-acetylglucosamine--N-acetylmuramyl-(pentapeptide) pyrophosphoryl-undecaprenol N-acetylglucosamine transferase